MRASADSGGESLLLTVSELVDVSDLVAAQQRLVALNAVSRVELVGLQGKRAQFRLYLLGTVEDVERGLSLDHHFLLPPAAGATPPAAAGAEPSATGSISLVSPEPVNTTEAAVAPTPTVQADAAVTDGLLRRWQR